MPRPAPPLSRALAALLVFGLVGMSWFALVRDAQPPAEEAPVPAADTDGTEQVIKPDDADADRSPTATANSAPATLSSLLPWMRSTSIPVSA